MIDITLDNFQQDLIAASQQQPVLLDIWAPWCAPCKALGPVLEKLEGEFNGAFVLAKLNSDEVPELSGQLSQMFGVRSIPFCVLFDKGQPVDGFVGALPEGEIRQFFDKHQISPAAPQAEETPATSEAETPAEQFVRLRDALKANPNDDETRFNLIKLMLEDGQLDVARALYNEVAVRTEQLGGHARLAAMGHCLTACERSETARDRATLDAAIAANPRDLDARFELAQSLFAEGDFTAALDALLEIIMRNKAWQDGLARKTFVAILELMTPPKSATAPAGQTPAQAGVIEVANKTAAQDPQLALIGQYRRQLAMMLN